MDPILIPTAEIIRFVLVLTRLSGIMILAPFFSANTVPVQIRVVFSIVTAFILAPSLPLNQVPSDLNLGNIAGLLITEILFGVILGFAALCVFAGLEFAGKVASFQLGFSIVNIIDPQTQVESSVFSFLYNYIALLIFLMINGHHWFLLAVNQSFSVLPIGGVHIRGPLALQLISFSASSLIIGVKIAAPIIAVTVIVDIVLGIIGRTAPQIHLLIV